MIVILGYASLARAADCFVDSVGGKDSNDGKSASTPVQSQAAIPKSGCTTMRYARGSQFNEAVAIINGVKTYTNYTRPNGSASDPLPDFKFVTGPVLIAMQGGITVDGLKLEGSHNQGGSLSSLQTGGGICVYVGNNSTVKNCEVTACDFAIFFANSAGNTASLATNNYVHDILGEAVDGDAGIDPNAVGGSKGIYVMADNVEVSYNTIINCVNYPKWTGANGSAKGGCDGGATEIAVASGGTLKGYKNHHNFAYNTCGFFQASTYFANNSGTAAQLGTFAHSEFSYNVMIDTAWMILAQVNNTDFQDMKWYNNTVVQHKGSAGPVGDQGMLMEMWNGVSSGTSGGVTPANQIFLTNNLMVLEGVNDMYDFNANWKANGSSMASNTPIVLTTNIFLNNTTLNPGFIKLGDGLTVPSPTDFDLTSDSAALSGSNSTISGGTPLAGQTLDFLNRAVPGPGGKTDIGAFQYGSTGWDGGVVATTDSGPLGVSDARITSTGGGSGTGGGGSSGIAMGGSGGNGGSGSSSASTSGQTGGSGNAAGGLNKGGAATATGGGNGGAKGTGGTTTSATASTEGAKSGCSCSLGQGQGTSGVLWVGLLGFAWRVVRRGRNRRWSRLLAC